MSNTRKTCNPLLYLIICIFVALAMYGFMIAKLDKQSKYHDVNKAGSESYTFDLNNDSFTGLQNNQEMGDYQICFYGNIEAFSGLSVGKGADQDVWKETLQISSDKITVWDDQNQKIAAQFSHEMTFKDYIAVNIFAKLNGTAKIEVLTNGSKFVKDVVPWFGGNGRLHVEATGGGTVMNDCTLSYHCNGWNKAIWLYGDSYFSLTDEDRWTYYLIENNAENILLSGHSGEGSVESLKAFKTQLLYGTPKTVIWCVGMNDGDSKEAVNIDYKESLDSLVSICDEEDIKLVLSTIPTCPYWFNDHKNELVKTSGYTFIDFADAVGSYDSIEWHKNMLEESDKRIHPTVEGAKALYSKAVATIPELLE